MTADKPRSQGEQVIAEDSVYRLGFAAVRHVITRDPQLPDGPFRTLIHYYEYAQRSDLAWPSVGTVAKALSKTERTVIRHRQTLVGLGYIQLITRNDHPALKSLKIERQANTTVVLLKNPAKIKRLKSIAAEVLDSRKKGRRKLTDDEQVIIDQIKRLGPSTLAARAILRDYYGDDPLADLVDRWVANRFHIPKSWGVGLIYRKLVRGEQPPGPKVDEAFMAAIKANQQRLLNSGQLPLFSEDDRDDRS